MSTSKVFLVPTSVGLVVRDPLTKQALSETGDFKPWIGPQGKYWRRRVMDGSCKITIKKEEITGNKITSELKKDKKFDSKIGG